MKALKKITTEGQVIDLGGVDCSLEMAQSCVGGLIENAYTSPDRKLTIWCNEEGLLEGLAYNALASQLIGGHIVGDVLIVENQEKDFG